MFAEFMGFEPWPGLNWYSQMLLLILKSLLYNLASAQSRCLLLCLPLAERDISIVTEADHWWYVLNSCLGSIFVSKWSLHLIKVVLAESLATHTVSFLYYRAVRHVDRNYLRLPLDVHYVTCAVVNLHLLVLVCNSELLLGSNCIWTLVHRSL